jgi:hypothetical protein
MTENYEKDFVPYEQALALKELGFESPYPIGEYQGGKVFYYEKGELYYDGRPMYSSDAHSGQLLTPLYQQAFRWFREKYNLDAWVQPFTLQKSNGDLYLPDETYSYFIFKYGVYVGDGVDFLEPEEAELECLKNLIEIVKQQL